MTHEEVKALVEEMGLPYAYDHFAEGKSPDPPFICFLYCLLYTSPSPRD